MNNHPDGYGNMFPDFTRLQKNKALVSPAFTALVEICGTGVQGRKLEVKRDGWETCVTCADYRTCFDLSLAKLLMGTVLANGWHGS